MAARWHGAGAREVRGGKVSAPLVRKSLRLKAADVATAARMAREMDTTEADVLRPAVSRGLVVLAADWAAMLADIEAMNKAISRRK